MSNAKKILWIVLLALSVVGICVAVFLFVPDTNTSKDAVEYFEATAEDQNCYIDIVGLSETVATYEGYGELGIRLAEDREGYMYVLAISDSEAAKYMEQVRFFYWGEDYSTAKSVKITGKSKAVDKDIKDAVIEAVNYLYDDEILTMGNYGEYMGNYYLNVNVSATSHGSFLAGVIVGFVSLGLLAIALYNLLSSRMAVVDKHRYGRALALGFAGMLIGALIPVAIGIFLDRIMWYAFICIPAGFLIGYNLVEKKMTVPVKVVFVLFSVIFGFLAVYCIYAWVYYESMNEYVGLSFGQAFTGLFSNMDAFEDSFRVKMNIGLATIVSLVGGIGCAVTAKEDDAVAGQSYTYTEQPGYVNPEFVQPKKAADATASETAAATEDVQGENNQDIQ